MVAVCLDEVREVVQELQDFQKTAGALFEGRGFECQRARGLIGRRKGKSEHGNVTSKADGKEVKFDKQKRQPRADVGLVIQASCSGFHFPRRKA
jgi:hypothetical protein